MFDFEKIRGYIKAEVRDVDRDLKSFDKSDIVSRFVIGEKTAVEELRNKFRKNNKEIFLETYQETFEKRPLLDYLDKKIEQVCLFSNEEQFVQGQRNIYENFIKEIESGNLSKK